jgi:hypothetical protein
MRVKKVYLVLDENVRIFVGSYRIDLEPTDSSNVPFHALTAYFQPYAEKMIRNLTQLSEKGEMKFDPDEVKFIEEVDVE